MDGNWGGSRSGAGRKSTGRQRVVVYVTPTEESAIKKLIDQLRNESSTPESSENEKVEEQLTLNIMHNNQDELNALESKYEEEIATLKLDHEDKIKEIRIDHDFEIGELKSKHKDEINTLKSSHKQEIDELTANYENEIDALKSSIVETNTPESSESESVEETPTYTVASNERIMHLYQINQGVRGIYKCVADMLNRRNELTEHGLQWTDSNLKKKI